MSDYLDGLMEGHESRRCLWGTRLSIIAVCLLSLVSAIINLFLIGSGGFQDSVYPLSLGIIGLIALMFIHINWYRKDSMDRKHRRATIAMILCLVLFDVAAIMAFMKANSYRPCPTPPPTPSTTTTPAPHPITTTTPPPSPTDSE